MCHHNLNTHDVVFWIFSGRTFNELSVIIVMCHKNKQATIRDGALRDHALHLGCCSSPRSASDHISNIMPKCHGVFNEIFTISFSNAGKTENLPEFEFE